MIVIRDASPLINLAIIDKLDLLPALLGRLPIMGLLGVLKIAKDKDLIPQLKPLLDQLIHEAGFRVSKALYQQILEQEREV